MKMRLLLALAGLVSSFALPSFAQTIDPQLRDNSKGKISK
jgi:Tfp pilus assembly protein FimT